MLNAKGSNSISNCWFDGEIRVEGSYGRYNGGKTNRKLKVLLSKTFPDDKSKWLWIFWAF